jgi:hypothetical protein
VIPLYGFVEGDSLGLLVLAEPDQTIASLARRLAESASVRVQPAAALDLRLGERTLDPRLTVAGAGLQPLDRVDAVASTDARDSASGDGGGTA